MGPVSAIGYFEYLNFGLKRESCEITPFHPFLSPGFAALESCLRRRPIPGKQVELSSQKREMVVVVFGYF